jgi:hypothetical protein
MDVQTVVQRVDPQVAREALAVLLETYLNPAFSALPKAEVDLAFMDALEKLGYISSSPSEYELVQKLRVTRAKARNLYYNRELRRRSPEQLDLLVRQALLEPLIYKDGDLFVLEVDSPLVLDHLRSKLRDLGFASDGSFSPSLVKVTVRGFAALVESYIPEGKKEQLKKKLIAAGVEEDTSFGAVLQGALRQLGPPEQPRSGAGHLMASATRTVEIAGPSIDAIELQSASG